jgi:hypothetical protein
MRKDRHHFKTAQYSYSPVNTFEQRDSMKHAGAHQQGITIITVPFWWDRTPERYVIA